MMLFKMLPWKYDYCCATFSVVLCDERSLHGVFVGSEIMISVSENLSLPQGIRRQKRIHRARRARIGPPQPQGTFHSLHQRSTKEQQISTTVVPNTHTTTPWPTVHYSSSWLVFRLGLGLAIIWSVAKHGIQLGEGTKECSGLGISICCTTRLRSASGLAATTASLHWTLDFLQITWLSG